MGNLCSIFHSKHDLLKSETGSSAKAEFLSKCIYWWQISKYKIKNSDHIWFTRTTDELAAGSGLSESSVGRYLRDFTEKNLIEKRVLKRYSRKHGQDIACLHIRITDKLLTLLKTHTKNPSTSNQQEADIENPDSNNLPQIDDTPSVNLTDPTINNKEDSPNNSISTVSNDGVRFGEKKKSSFEKTIFPIEKDIGERVSEEIKDQIKGMLYNVLKTQGQELKHNERLFTEVLFAVTNKEQFKDVSSIAHRINIAASLIRKKRWKTPKGFYNHWDIGQAFKEREEVKRRRMQQQKLEQELLGVSDPQQIAEIKARIATSEEYEARFDKKQTPKPIPSIKGAVRKNLVEKLNALNRDIQHESRYLKQMEQAFRQGENYVNQALIDSIGIKLAKLYEQQTNVEQQLESIKSEFDLCA